MSQYDLELDLECGSVFPDPTLVWRPYPSMIDGIGRSPYVYDQGLWKGVLHLIVLGPEVRDAYGIEIECEAYAAFEEVWYSIVHHGDDAGCYDGGVYIKEAESSALLKSFSIMRSFVGTPRHFSFVGGDYCFEVLGFSEPKIQAFSSQEEARMWGPSRAE